MGDVGDVDRIVSALELKLKLKSTLEKRTKESEDLNPSVANSDEYHSDLSNEPMESRCYRKRSVPVR